MKWLRAITVSDDAFQGVQISEQYRYKTSASDPGTPIREKRVNSVMTPPGIPDLISRFRFLAPGSYTITGKAWSGMGSITSVEFSSDNGQTFRPTTIRRPFSDANAWVAWSAPWAPTAGQYTLRCRATDSAGNTQPLLANTIFNYQGNAINAADSIPVTVQSGIGTGLAEFRPIGAQCFRGRLCHKMSTMMTLTRLHNCSSFHKAAFDSLLTDKTQPLRLRFLCFNSFSGSSRMLWTVCSQSITALLRRDPLHRSRQSADVSNLPQATTVHPEDYDSSQP